MQEQRRLSLQRHDEAASIAATATDRKPELPEWQQRENNRVADAEAAARAYAASVAAHVWTPGVDRRLVAAACRLGFDFEQCAAELVDALLPAAAALGETETATRALAVSAFDGLEAKMEHDNVVRESHAPLRAGSGYTQACRMRYASLFEAAEKDDDHFFWQV